MNAFITFVGALTRDQLPRYYSGADLYWLLSAREADSFGLVYAEAQACGLPALGLRCSGVVEAVCEGRSGYLAETGDECISILLKRAYLGLDEKAIVAFAERFYLTRQSVKLEALL